MTTPNTIYLKGDPRYDEFNNAAICKPGQILLRNSTGKVIPHNVVGGSGPIIVAIEDALRGFTKDDAIPNNDLVRCYHAKKGDMFLCRLAAGENVANGAKLMSAGTGALQAYPSGGGDTLYNITAASTNITNTSAETTFSNGSYAIPANTLKAGDIVRIRGRATVTGQNSTNTHQVKVYLGSTAIADSGAVALAANDVVEWDLTLTCRTAGASGTFVLSGTIAAGTPGTVTTKAVQLASTAIDTTVANTVAVKSTASAASTGNIIRLDEYSITENDAATSGFAVLFEAAEAKDNSAGTDDTWIRALVA
jgi:hypothetical protein